MQQHPFYQMQSNGTALWQAMRTQCQRERWFGADPDNTTERIVTPDVERSDEDKKHMVRVEAHPGCGRFVFPPATEEDVQVTEA